MAGKIVKRVVLGLVILLVVLTAGAYLIPDQVHVERQTTIAAAPDAIYPRISDVRRWTEWMPWNQERDPSVKWTFSDPPTGPGASFSWTSDTLGAGKLTLSKCEPGRGVDYDLLFEGEKQLSSGKMILEPEGAGTKVTWTFDASMGWNPVARYMGLMMDRLLGPDYESGLARLKTQVEATEPPATAESPSA